MVCYETDLSELDVNNNTALIWLECRATNISELDVTNNALLKTLECSETGISELDLSNNTALTNLSCFTTGVTELDVHNNTALTILRCSNTAIVDLDISENVLLEELSCNYTNITALDVSNNTALKKLECSNATLAYVNVTNNTGLTSFDASGNAYSIPSNATKFDTSVIAGFDPAKVSDVANADFDAATGIFSNITGDVTYTYDCGNSISQTFTLTRTGEAVFDGTLYTEDGDITITETGVTQGDAAEETAWTGDYIITQRDSSTAVDCAISVTGVEHTIVFDEVNIETAGNTFSVDYQTKVNLSSTGNSSTLVATGGSKDAIWNNGELCISAGMFNLSGGYNGIENLRTLIITDATVTSYGDYTSALLNHGNATINGGTVDLTGKYSINNVGTFTINDGNIIVNSLTNGYGIQNEGALSINGGNITVTGKINDLFSPDGTTTVSGSSLKFTNNKTEGAITNVAGTTVYCAHLPCTDPTTVTIYDNLDVQYTDYNVNAVHNDGYAYIWLPAGSYYIHVGDAIYNVSVTENGSTVTQQ